MTFTVTVKSGNSIVNSNTYLNLAITDQYSYSGLKPNELAAPLIAKIFLDNELPYA